MMDGIILPIGQTDLQKINNKDMRSMTNTKGLNAIINSIDKFSTYATYFMAVGMFFFILFQILR
jgi:hypothetical protein